ncbi:hypothetical protein K9M47_00675 [Candidatus Gracilibacteria bacterium]|nr:hypothetical protein [Candidatus Gracilibacteria bacterium]MCF7898356.1 hypothetical protein [Candidatus Paceibacterota bacterium]
MINKNSLFLKVVAGALMSSLGFTTVFAASLSGMSDTLSTAKISTVSNHTIVFTTPTGLGNGSTTVIEFESDFEMEIGLTFTDVDINVGGPYVGSTTLAAAPSATELGVVRTSSTTLTITSASSTIINPGDTVYIRIGTNAIFQSTGVNAIRNTTTSGSKTVAVGGTMTDNGTTTVTILNDDTVQVNAIVPQSLTFSISSNSINFGNLGSGAPKYASSTNTLGDTVDTVAHTLDVSTNAPSGYAITVKGQTLTSQQNPADTISAIGGTPATSSAGTEQFGIYATKAGGINGTIATPYATASSFGYDATATTSATFASGSSSTNAETYSLHYIANIAGLTEAGTYSANLIYVGTANF